MTTARYWCAVQLARFGCWLTRIAQWLADVES
jgi:hypothetical protein